MSLVPEQAAFLLDMGKTVVFATGLGFQVTGGEYFRTPEQQKIYVDTGRSKTLDSYHLKRLADDLNFFKDGKLIYDKAVLQPIGDFFESLSPEELLGWELE